MEGFTLTHDACGKPATISFYEEEQWVYDGESEYTEYVNSLLLTCDACNVTVDIEPKEVGQHGNLSTG